MRQPARVGSVLGRYLLLRSIGRGGMGAVYEAVHQDLGRHVAIKTLQEGQLESDEACRRFLREGQAAARIRHPNVVDVYDVAIEGEQPYLVMEYLEGEDLRCLLRREGPLSVQRCADLLLPVVAGLAAAHDLGVVHRDLKPENVFLSAARGAVVPKILDFGIAKSLDRGESLLTGTGAFLGTPYYVSPEQAQGARDIDARSDQYSLGVMLYECVLGQRPIEESSAYALLLKIVNGDFTSPRQRDPLLPGAFEALILKAMALQVSDRFDSTRALGQALAAFASARVQGDHALELAQEPPVFSSTPAQHDSSAPEWLGTTLGESGQRPVVTQLVLANEGGGRRWWLALPLGLAALIGVALLARSQAATRVQERTWAASPPVPGLVPELPASPEIGATPSAAPAAESAAPAQSEQATSPPATSTSPPAAGHQGAPARALQSDLPLAVPPASRRRSASPPARNDAPVELPPLAPR